MTTPEELVSNVKQEIPVIKQQTINAGNALNIWVKTNPYKAVFLLGFIVGFILGTII
jgi:hypothetical protein